MSLSLIRRCFVTLVLAFVFSSSLYLPLFAQTPEIEQKKAEAEQVKAQINQVNEELEVVVEQYNVLEIKLSETERSINETRNKLQVAQVNLERSHRILADRLKSIYKNGPSNFLLVILSTRSFSDFLTRLDWLTRIGQQDAKILKEVRENKISIEKLEARLDLERQAQVSLKGELGLKKKQIEVQLQERKNFLAGIEVEIDQLIKEEEERQRRVQEEFLRQLQLEQEKRQGLQGTPDSTDNAVIAIALQYLGVVYHWAGEGPGKCPTGVHSICFDCSGFTLYVYRQIGISLPHSSVQQYTYGAPVERTALSPGDLVFFGSRGVSHVGIYIGGGNFIHASSNGDVVKTEPLDKRTDYIGARRLL